MFTQEELRNMFALINRASITGQEALPTALLLNKIKELSEKEPLPETPVPETDKKSK